MKNALIIMALCGFAGANSQSMLHLNGGSVFIGSAADVYVGGTVNVASPNGNLIQLGDLTLSGDMLIFGLYQNASASGISRTRFVGNTSSTIRSNGKLFNTIEVDKTNADLDLIQNLTIVRELKFLADGSFLKLGNFTATLNNTASISGASANRFVVTNGNGMLRKNTCNLFEFPVGFNSVTYNPLTINELGVKDAKSVRALEHPLTNGSTGVPLANGAADVSWLVTESAAGGSNATLTCQWKSADELPAFNQTNCAVFRNSTGTWVGGSGSAAAGSDPYTQTAAGFAQFGHFMVATPGAFLTNADDRAEAEFPEISRDETGAQTLDYQVFPNPSAGFVQVRPKAEFPPETQLVLFDARGSEVRRFNLLADGLRLDLSGLAAGLYFLQANSPGQAFACKRLIVK